MRDGTATKELIRQTALALFAEKWVRETTIHDIAGRGGVAEARCIAITKARTSSPEISKELGTIFCGSSE